MSSQKDKFLASAQKFIQKGQFERALRDYEQVVTADPKDIRHRQKLAELLVRCNRKEDALQEYETIAKYYDENGFYLKSIAVYKQIQRLDPTNIDISLALAALNEKQGMIGNALSEYKMVFDHYEKSGKTAEAIAILRRMQGVDPENAEIRMKLAETEFAAGSVDSAYQEFTRVALALKNRGNTAAFDKVCHRIRELFPERSESVLDIITEQVRNGMSAEAIPKLRQMLDSDPENLRLLGLLADAYQSTGDRGGREPLLRKMLQLSPDDLAVKRGLIDCAMAGDDLEGAVALLEKYLPDFMGAGQYGEIEHFYTSLQNQAPYDVRLLEGLRKLYEVTGESSKLADVQVSLNILSQKGVVASKEAPDDGHGHGLIDLSTTEVTSASGPADSAWGDEIDLSLDEDSMPAEEAEEPGSSPVPVEAPIQRELNEPETSASDDFEIDISFELPENADLFQAPGEGEPKAVETVEPEPEEPSCRQQVEAAHDEPDDFLEEFTLELEDVSESPALFEQSVETVPQPEDDLPPAWVVEPGKDEDVEAETCLPPAGDSAEAKTETVSEESTPQPEPEVEGLSDKYAFDGIFSRFKESLDQHVDSGDTETHYNLGIAYMEMGLFDDAIKEFHAAGNDPKRNLDCLTLQGVCCREKGDFTEAERVFSAMLSRGGLDPDRMLSIHYELGLLHETAGRKEDALKSYREVFSVQPGFRDTMKKIALLSGKQGSFDLSDLDEVDIDLEEIE